MTLIGALRVSLRVVGLRMGVAIRVAMVVRAAVVVRVVAARAIREEKERRTGANVGRSAQRHNLRKRKTLGHPCDTTLALVWSRVMKGHRVTTEVQTKLSVQVVLPNGEFKALRVLVDFGCQAVALANPNVFGDQISEEYESPQGRRLPQADNETRLPGGGRANRRK